MLDFQNLLTRWGENPQRILNTFDNITKTEISLIGMNKSPGNYNLTGSLPIQVTKTLSSTKPNWVTASRYTSVSLYSMYWVI